jgi:hypothetical protein
MIDDTRREGALNAMWLAKREIERATTQPDPVEQRRCEARAAKHLRRAADALDDSGRLGE